MPIKAMSEKTDTPITDAAEIAGNIKNQSDKNSDWPWAAIKRGYECARDLERQLAEAREHNARLMFDPTTAPETFAALNECKNSTTPAGYIGKAMAKVERQRDEWKRSHYHVCKKLATCENDRDFNAELCEKAEKERDALAEALLAYRSALHDGPENCTMLTAEKCNDMADKALATLDQKEK